MKKIFYLFTLTLYSCTFTGNISDPNITSIRDQDGRTHIYAYLKLGEDNWCYEHKQYELVRVDRSKDDE